MDKMKIVDKIKESKELNKQISDALEQANQAHAEAFARALRMNPLEVKSNSIFGISHASARANTGFRSESVLSVRTDVRIFRLKRFLRKRNADESNKNG